MKLLLCLFLVSFHPISYASADFSVEDTKDGVAVKLDGKLFALYLENFETKPIWHPIIGPSGKPMTRPLGEGDHPHHASFFFTHGNVNGTDFWHKKGPEHLEYIEKSVGDDKAVVTTRSAWKSKDDKIVGEEIRRTTFHVIEGNHVMDVDIIWTADDGDVEFGKTKEGSFGLRVPPSMTVDKGGHIVNSRGQKDGDAWGKEAEWVGYSGDLDGEKLGIAILTHPDHFRFPHRWHVRTYGLFAANPFMHEAFELKAGASFRIHHRVLFHKGDTASAKIADLYKTYSESEIPSAK